MNADILPCHTISKVFEDNNGALILATTACMTPCSNHITVKYHFFEEYVHQGKIHMDKATDDQRERQHRSKLIYAW